MFQILTARGYQVEYRGLVAVKGKGDMETYYVLGKAAGGFGGFTRQPSQHASLAAVVYGMVQARRRQNTVKRSNTREFGFGFTNSTNIVLLFVNNNNGLTINTFLSSLVHQNNIANRNSYPCLLYTSRCV